MVEPADLPILVTGASGKLGRLIVCELLDRFGVPPEAVIAATRSPDLLADFSRRGVVVRRADFDEPHSLAPAFRGARRMIVISTMGVRPYVDGQRSIQQIGAIRAGVAAGVDHIFYTSAPNPEPGTPAFWKHDHYRTEVALTNSGVKWTILRHWEWPNWHLSENWLSALKTGRYFTACGDGEINWVTREDHARADAGALVSGTSANQRFDLTGPEPLNMSQVMAMFGKVAGRDIEIVRCEPQELEGHLVEAGTDPDAIPFFVDGARAVRRGLYAGKTNAIEELTGIAPTLLLDFLAANADAVRAGRKIP